MPFKSLSRYHSPTHLTIVSLEYTDDVSGKTVIAKVSDPNFAIALDMAALRATGFLKMGVKWDTQEDLFERSLPAKTYTLELEKSVKEIVYGQELTRKLGDLTYLATANQKQDPREFACQV